MTTEELAPPPGDPGPIGARPDIEPGEFPWWLVIIGALLAWMIFLVITSNEYTEAFSAMSAGLAVTLSATAIAFVVATVMGLIIGLGRLSKNPVLRTISTTYIELIRGIPFIVWVFVVAFVIIRAVNSTFGIDPKIITPYWQGVTALASFYAAFIAEVFRAGIQSVPHGQTEAARALGLTKGKILRHVILPQAVRNMLPALGNDLIALFKDTALLSIIAARDITYLARTYSSSNFRFRETFFVLTMFYVTITIILSLLLRAYEKKMEIPGRM